MKSVQDILQTLNLDLTNPEVVKAATEAIGQILSGRSSVDRETLADRLGNKAQRPGDEDSSDEPIDLGEFNQAIDPNLIQPPSQSGGSSDIDMDIEDEDDVLSQVKQVGNQNSQPEDDSDNDSSSGNDSGSNGNGQQDQQQLPPQNQNENPFGSDDTSDDSSGEKQDNNSGSSDSSSDSGSDSTGSDNSSSDSDSDSSNDGSDGSSESQSDSSGTEGNSNGTDKGKSNSQQNKPNGSEDSESPGPGTNAGMKDSAADEGSDEFGDQTDGDTDGANGAETGDDLSTASGGDEFDDDEEEFEDDAFDDEGLEDDEDGENSDADFSSKVSGKNPKNEAQRIQAGRTLKAAEKALEKAQDAGQNAIAKLLENCCKALADIIDKLESDPNEEISEQKMSQVIQRTLDAIGEVDKHGLTFKSDEERSQQVKRIKDAMSDTGTAAELSAEDVEQIRADKQAVVNAKKEIEKYASRSRSSFKGFEDFVQSLRKSLALQIEAEKTKANSWAAINRRHDGTDVVKPGIKNRTLPSTRVPVIDFYFDCSASWDSHDIMKGNEALGKIAQLEKDGEIKVNVFYFADHVFPDEESPRDEGGTGAWNHIIDNIVLTRATNVVIMTDSDMQWQCDEPPHKGYKVTGFVWYLWKDGVNAPKLPTLLQGRSGTLQYSFSSQ